MIARHSSCKPHPFQDKRYGDKMRVVNKKRSYDETRKVNCTVCGEEFAIGEYRIERKKRK